MAGDPAPEALLAAARLIWYLGILGVVGASTCRLLVFPAAGPAAPVERAAVTAGLAGAGLLAAGTLGRLYAQTYAYFGQDEGVTWTLLLEVARGLPPWSAGWSRQAAAAAASLAAFALVSRSPRAGWPAAYAAALAVVATAPMTGHAIAQESWPRLPIVLQAGHVLGAGVWMGGLAVLLWATRFRLTLAPAAVAGLVERFSPVALTGASLVAATGVVTLFLYVRDVSDLWTTPYGLTLVMKVVFFATVATAGFVNWRVVRPRLAEPDGVTVLRRTAAIELLFAALVLALTAWLVGLPQP